MQKIIKGNILFIIVLAIAIVFTFWNLPQTFYQQDEWQVLGLNLVQGTSNIIKYTSPLQLLFGEGRPLVRALNLIFFGIFKFTVIPTALFAILMHIVNSVLVFYLVKKITLKNVIAFIASLFFAVNAVAHQAVTWAAAVGTLPATTLILLSILSYLKFLEEKKKKWLLFSFFSTIISLLFKENGIFLFVFIPALYFIYNKKRTSIDFIKTHVLFIFYGGAIVLFRLSEFSLSIDKKVGVFVSGGTGFNQRVLLHLILYPITGFFQIFVPPLTFYNLANKFTQLQYPFVISTPLAGLVPQTIVSDLIAVIGTLIIVSLVLLLNRNNKYKDTTFLLFSIFLTLFSFLPYAVLDRGGSYMDSRYYYLAAIGGGMILGYILNFFLQKTKILVLIPIILASLLIFFHIKVIKDEISYQVKIARVRLYILNTIKQTHPTLSNKNIFYIIGNQDYYISNNPLPMQQGMGYTLMVWYYDTKKIPSALLNDNFIWNIGSQGYKEINGAGFGYFSDFNTLLETYKKYDLLPEKVISFYWDGKKEKLIDTSVKIRTFLK